MSVDFSELTNYKSMLKTLEKNIDYAVTKSVVDVTKKAMKELWETTPVDTGRLRDNYFITGAYTEEVNSDTPTIEFSQVMVYNNEYYLEIVNLAIGVTLHKGEYYQMYVNKGHKPTNYGGHFHIDKMEDNAQARLPVILKQEIKKAIDKWK